MDKILIPDFRISCRVGVPQEERDVAQDVLIDVELHLDLSPAGRADDVAQTVDYAEVCKTIATTVERWDGESTARKMELQVGRDLQFIRINGTIVGGLAGVMIHFAGEFL